jgi:multiple sugar transport system substrate-binding protein
MRRVGTFGVLLAVLVLVGAACTDSPEADEGVGGGGGSTVTGGGADVSGEPVTLDFWVYEGRTTGFMDALIDGFQAEHPNVTVNVTAYPENNYGIKLDTAIAAGKAPDLVLVFGNDQMRAGLLEPLDDMIEAQGIDLSTYVPAIVEPGDEFSCAYEDHLYCLGSYIGSVQLLYNKDLFDAAGIAYPAPWPPMTPDEFVDIACQLTDEATGVWGGAASDPLAYIPFDMMFSPDGRTAIGYTNGPDFVHQMEVLASGYDRGCLPTSNVLDPWEQGRDYFSQGQLAMVITDFQDLPQVEEAGINYGTTAVPTPVGVTPYFFTWSDSVGVMSGSEHVEEAKAFVAYLTTAGQQIRYETTGDIPLDLAVADEVNWAAGIPGREEGLEILSHARPLVFVPQRWDVVAPYYDAWGFVIGGEKAAQEALDDAAPAIQENLDKAWQAWESQGS